MAASPPAPTPMSAAARQPAGKLVARASRKMPSAVIRFIASATRGPKNRSSSHPTTILPSGLDPPRIGCVLRQRGRNEKGHGGSRSFSAYKRKGVYSDGSKFAAPASLDGGGFAYSKKALGSTQLWDGVLFNLGPAGSIGLPNGPFASRSLR
jgi:hypothetical protein